MASPFWVASGAGVSAPGGTAANFGAPAGVAANSVIVVDFFLDTAADHNVVPPDGTWFAAENIPIVANNHRHYVYWHRASGGEAGPYTFTWTGGTYVEGQAHRYEGCATTGNPFDAGAAAASSGAGTSNQSPPVSITTLGAERLLVHAATDWAGGTWTPPTGFTKREQLTVGLVTLSDLAQAVAGGTPALQATCTSIEHTTAWLGALRPAGIVATFSTGILPPSVIGRTVAVTLAFTNAVLPVTSTIEWGDGSTTSGAGVGPFTHTYNANGVYAIMVTSTDAGASVDSAAIAVNLFQGNVLPGPPTAWSTTGVANVVNQLLSAVSAALSGTSGGTPKRVVFEPGADVPWDECDCGQLALAVRDRYTSRAFPSSAIDGRVGNCENVVVVFDCALSLTRCVPIPDANGKAPTPHALSKYAARQEEDAYVVWNTTQCFLMMLRDSSPQLITDFIVNNSVSLGPQGACSGTQLNFKFGLYVPCGC